MAGFFERLGNIWGGFLSLWISDIETRNPEAVYEAAIDERVKKHRELKKAVSGIVYLRNKLTTEMEEKQLELTSLASQIPVAIEEGEDEIAMLLLQKQEELEGAVAMLTGELDKVQNQAEESKRALIQFQGEIEKLKREKEQMLAQKANAEARITINETLDGLSTEADIKALENVRENIGKLKAEADMSSEIRGDSLDEKLSRIKEKAATSTAKMKLDAMKKQLAAKRAASQGAAVKKTI